MTNLLYNGPKDSPITFLMAHGAGAPMDHPFMNTMAEGVAAHGFQVVRFEFPYMAQQRLLGKKRAPNTQAILTTCFQEQLDKLSGKVIIGGKSMGGRIASMIYETSRASGCICLGYPFHPPGKPEKLRTAHLEKVKKPMLILQGERDPFGKATEIQSYALSNAIRIEYLTDGEHSFKSRKSSPVSSAQNWQRAVKLMAEFLEQQASR